MEGALAIYNHTLQHGPYTGALHNFSCASWFSLFIVTQKLCPSLRFPSALGVLSDSEDMGCLSVHCPVSLNV